MVWMVRDERKSLTPATFKPPINQSVAKLCTKVLLHRTVHIEINAPPVHTMCHRLLTLAQILYTGSPYLWILFNSLSVLILTWLFCKLQRWKQHQLQWYNHWYTNSYWNQTTLSKVQCQQWRHNCKLPMQLALWTHDAVTHARPGS